MNKFWKPTLVFFMIIGFLVSTMVCCCVTRLAQAAMVQAKAKSCCHAKAGNSEHQAKDCDTCSKNRFRAGTFSLFKVVIPATYVLKSVDAVSFILPFQFPMKSVSFHGPPKAFSDLPLYLKTHSLRI